MWNGRHLKKQMYGSPDYHTFVSYFWVFQMSTISCVFRPTALKLGCITNFDMLFLVMGIISTSPLCRGVATKESRDASGGRPSLLARTLLQNGAFLLLTWEPGDKNQTEPPF